MILLQCKQFYLVFYNIFVIELPDSKTSAVVLGSRNLIITAAKRFGLYSAFLHFKAICFKSSLQFKFAVETTFLKKQNIKWLNVTKLWAQCHHIMLYLFSYCKFIN